MGIEKEGAKFRAGQEPAETQAKIVQWTILLTRTRVDPLPAPKNRQGDGVFVLRFNPEFLNLLFYLIYLYLY